MMRPLILASTSRYRRALLERLGLPFEAVSPAVDEETLKDPVLAPAALAAKLAEAKARSLVAKYPDATIIGSDQVCVCEGRILSKPGNFEAAKQQLQRLSGKSHQLLTAVSIVDRGTTQALLDTTTLWMRSLEEDEIERYLLADRPYDCAGSYKLESRGIALFGRIESHDHTAIVGLPLMTLAQALRDCGHVMP